MKTRGKCLCCNKKGLSQIINLGKHSFADRFISQKNLVMQKIAQKGISNN